MDKKRFAITAIGVAVIGAVISIKQYKEACAETKALENELEELKKYNAQLDAIKQQIEARKDIADDFIYTTRQQLGRINKTLKLVEDC